MIHGPETKARIQAQIERHDISVSSEVVKQEFKRRLLKEAQYLLNQLNKRGSYEKVRRHVLDCLPPQMVRKQKICLQTLESIFEGRDDEELTERAKRSLRRLIKFGLGEFEETVGSIVREVACACSRYPVQEKKTGVFDFGTDRCSKVEGACGIASFLDQRRDILVRIREALRSLPPMRKTQELTRAEAFLDQVLEDPGSAMGNDPCLKVGDLVFALESVGIPIFYTLNYRESRHYCRWLDQDLIVRPINPEHEDILCAQSEPDWDTILEKRSPRSSE
jgi:hypothetical protein